MRRTKRNGSFLLCLLINMLLNLDGLLPAAVLLVLHFVLDWSFWWAVIAAGLWLAGLILWMRRNRLGRPVRQHPRPAEGK